MQRMTRHTYYVILGIFIASACLTMAGLAYIWFWAPAVQPPVESAQGAAATPVQPRDLPYLKIFVSTLLVEAVGVVFWFMRNGLKYLPEVKINKTEEQTFRFMRQLLTYGTSVTIVSNRLSLLTRSEEFRAAVTASAQNDTSFEFITRIPVPHQVRQPREQAGVTFYVTG